MKNKLRQNPKWCRINAKAKEEAIMVRQNIGWRPNDEKPKEQRITKEPRMVRNQRNKEEIEIEPRVMSQ